ncbi:MAG TPA: HD-GYP domain-containing protein [Candidatus Dormibacteraeota bacterium]|nr:HD-GYP domain-containing protein [Candidatus Dormibacteraeota bacterium]
MGIGAPELIVEPAPSASPTPPAAIQVPGPERRWRRRPVLRAALEIVVVLVPAVAAVGVAILFSRTVPAPPDTTGTVLWWVGFSAAFAATWLIAAELLQRTLPLATLLDLSLVFPNSVPSRYSILRRKVDKRRLEADLLRLRQMSDPESGTRAQLILELAVALSLHDSRTRGHSERVRMYTDLVAHELHLPERDIDRLRWAALLHDIGKLAVAPEILNKPEFPDDDELETLRNHPVEGYRLIAPLHRWLGDWAATVRDHHERFDGTGYPYGLAGTAISLGGRIVAVTDSYETMTAGRPYRNALSMRAAREELVRRSGSHFDPDVVRAFLATSAARVWPIVGLGALFAQLPFLGPVSSRLTQLGSRSVSGLAATSLAVTLIAAGVAGPAVQAVVYGPSSRPATAAAIAPANPVVTPPSNSSAAPNQPLSSPASVPATSTTSNPTASTPPPAGGGGAGGGGGVGKAIYPAGIAKHAVLPAGIAKQANPFANWRLHH